MLLDFSPRTYQSSIFETAKDKNTLVVLPTGLGKTAIAMMLAARRFLMHPSKKVVFLAPTKPLVIQHLESFQKQFALPEEKFALFTGAISPEKRKSLWSQASIIFSTPQTLENDVLSGRISFKDVSLLIFDEAHRATGDYAYVFLAKEYVSQSLHQRILALTASPGTDNESINNIMHNLFIEALEYRKKDDSDVAEHTQDLDVSWEHVVLNEPLEKIVSWLKAAYIQRLNQVKEYGFLSNPVDSYRKTALLQLQHKLHGQISSGKPPVELLHSISLLSQALKIQHALELAETQTIYALHEYIQGIISQSRVSKVRSVKQVAIDPNVLSALAAARDLIANKVEHPKLLLLINKIKDKLNEQPDAKILIFTQFRDTALRIEEFLDGICSSSIFFGQAKKNGVGFSQKKQKEVLDSFKANKFSCLIATSVAEEGLDIPSVAQVYFYEPIPSAIRSLQRRGRTGRHTKGFVTVFVTKQTRDEAHRWVAHHKEKRMYDVLSKLSKNTPLKRSLDQFTTPKEDISIVCDHREKGSPVLKALRNLGVKIELRQLDVGDYVISKECCVEYKTFPDFIDSIVDGRLLTQLRSLSQYSKPVIVLEGETVSSRLVDNQAILGMLTTISLSYRIPILRTTTSLESAQHILSLAKREQTKTDEGFTYHTAKPLEDRELLEYVVGSLPGVGGVLAKSLLQKFDTLQSLVNASQDNLLSIPLIGKKKAKQIIRILSLSYKSTSYDKNIND